MLKTVSGFWLLAAALTANMAESVSLVMIASLGGGMLDSIIALDGASAVSKMLLIGAFIFILVIGVIVKDSLLGIYQENGMVRLRAKTVKALGSARMSWLDSKHSGELSARVSNDLNELGNALRPVLIMGISQVMVQIVAVVYMFATDWLLTLIIFAAVPVTTLLQWICSNPIKKYRTENQNAIGALSSVIYDCFGSFETVKSLSLENEMAARFRCAQERQAAATIRETHVLALLTPLSVLGKYLPQFLLVFVGGMFAIDGRLSVGYLVMFLTLSSSAVNVLGNIADLISAIRRLSVSAERITSLWDVPSELPGGLTELPEDTGFAAVFENVSFGYGKKEGLPIIENVSLDVEKGSFTALVGESGCGKSTLLKLATGLYEPDAGVVRILGREVREWDVRTMRLHMAYVTQDTFLFPGTLRENITGDRAGISEERLAGAIRTSQLLEFIESLPMGLETQVGERGVFLSGGQRQRISVARALCSDVSLLLFDEATSALDKMTEAALVNAVTGLKSRPALIMITHRLANIREADNIVVLKDGRVCEEGTHEILEAIGGEYSRLLGLQRGDMEF